MLTSQIRNVSRFDDTSHESRFFKEIIAVLQFRDALSSTFVSRVAQNESFFSKSTLLLRSYALTLSELVRLQHVHPRDVRYCTPYDSTS